DSNLVVIKSEVISGDQDECGVEYLITRKWSVSDCAGNTTEYIQLVTVQDTAAPEFEGDLPAQEIVASCDDIPAMVDLTATDNCDSNLVVIKSEVISGDQD
ncbi:hypothetical protein H3Z83_12870, partial [Tenacibaculum sp. S7007]